VRSGEVGAINDWPRESPDVVLTTLGLKKSERDQLDLLFKGMDNRKVLLTNVNVAPGDSGGPLVDKEGRLIGVTFAVPTADGKSREGGLSLHVHLDEIKAFLPDALPSGPPPVFVPDLMPAGMYYELADLQGDGQPDALIFGRLNAAEGREERTVTGLLLDLKRSNADVRPDDLADPARRRAWKAHFALHAEPYPIAFYDTRGAGRIDLILFSGKTKGRADVILRYDGKEWKAEPGKGRPLVDLSNFTDMALRRSFLPYTAALRRLFG
jgi:serine protease Do